MVARVSGAGGKKIRKRVDGREGVGICAMSKVGDDDMS